MCKWESNTYLVCGRWIRGIPFQKDKQVVHFNLLQRRENSIQLLHILC